MRLVALVAVVLVTGGGGGTAAGQAPAACADTATMRFVCGPQAAEDFVHVPGTAWLIGSGYGDAGRNGRLHLVDTSTRAWHVLYVGGASAVVPSREYPACTSAPDAAFGAHGIALRAGRGRRHTLYVVNHAREAIEVFEVDARGRQPSVSWLGCIMAPPGVYVNSVAVAPDGALVATKFYDLAEGITSIFQGKVQGAVLEWQPARGWRTLPRTEMLGANGLEVSDDGRWVYVAAWGAQQLVRISRADGGAVRQVVSLDFWPDNVKWASNGDLLVAGQIRTVAEDRASAPSNGWKVVRVNHETFAVTELLRDDGSSPFQNLSAAIEVNRTLWLGPFRGDRIGYVSLPPSR